MSSLGKRKGVSRTHLLGGKRRMVYNRAKPASISRAAILRSRLPGQLRMKGPEKKSVDLEGPVNVISTTPTFDLLNGIQEGSSFYNRIGRRINMVSLHLRGQIIVTGLGAGASEYLRVMVVYDRQPNGAAPAIADLLLDYNNAGATTTSSFSHINMNNADRFVMLADIPIAIPWNAQVAQLGDAGAVMDRTKNEVNINRFIRLKDLETHYKSSTNPAAIGDIATGALWLVTVGNQNAATAGFAVVYTTRLRYHDV